ncbi:uncharacterized protein [Drosophila virilis]|uniref:uncharacterized protein n=1 Tax=Drosophila virilis TaxID=7244 RepID=UPI0038B3D737
MYDGRSTRAAFQATTTTTTTTTMATRALLLLLLAVNQATSMSLDRLALERNELPPAAAEVQHSTVVVDDMKMAALPAHGATDMYMLVPESVASQLDDTEHVHRNTIESDADADAEAEAENAAVGESADMLMLESDDTPAMQLVELPSDITVAELKTETQTETAQTELELEAAAAAEPVVAEIASPELIEEHVVEQPVEQSVEQVQQQAQSQSQSQSQSSSQEAQLENAEAMADATTEAVPANEETQADDEVVPAATEEEYTTPAAIDQEAAEASQPVEQQESEPEPELESESEMAQVQPEQEQLAPEEIKSETEAIAENEVDTTESSTVLESVAAGIEEGLNAATSELLPEEPNVSETQLDDHPAEEPSVELEAQTAAPEHIVESATEQFEQESVPASDDAAEQPNAEQPVPEEGASVDAELKPIAAAEQEPQPMEILSVPAQNEVEASNPAAEAEPEMPKETAPAVEPLESQPPSILADEMPDAVAPVDAAPAEPQAEAQPEAQVEPQADKAAESQAEPQAESEPSILTTIIPVAMPPQLPMLIQEPEPEPIQVVDSVLNYVNASFVPQQQQDQMPEQDLEQETATESAFSAQLRRYDGAQLWRIVVQTDKDKKLADELQSKYDGQLWKEVKQEVDYLLKPQVLAAAERHIRAANLSRIVLIDNLQQVIEVENPPADKIAELQNRKGHRLTWQAYHRLEDIHGFIDYMAKTYPDICSTETIGHSVEKRPLKILKISNGNARNPGIWIDGGMHAREWISPATVTYIANQLVEGWEDLPEHMRNINWYIHPVANPDGYEYSHTTDRLWRKNMRAHGRQCPGVDLNRNFGYKWGGKGTSASPCSQTYRGSKAFSEPETFYISKFISGFPRDTFQAYLSFHSYGQYILYPWGYDYHLTKDRADLDRVARQAGSIITKSSGVKYTVGSSATTLYPAAGGSDDWAKGIAGIKYAYTIEMGDTGRYGFVLPAQFIQYNGKDGYTFADTVARAVALGRSTDARSSSSSSSSRRRRTR